MKLRRVLKAVFLAATLYVSLVLLIAAGLAFAFFQSRPRQGIGAVAGGLSEVAVTALLILPVVAAVTFLWRALRASHRLGE